MNMNFDTSINNIGFLEYMQEQEKLNVNKKLSSSEREPQQTNKR